MSPTPLEEGTNVPRRSRPGRPVPFMTARNEGAELGSRALLMMLFERDVCTIGVKTRTFVSTSDDDHPVDSRNDRAALHYPGHGLQRWSLPTKRVVANCEN